MDFFDFECLVKDYRNVGSSLEDFQDLNYEAQILIKVCAKLGCNASAFEIFKEFENV